MLRHQHRSNLPCSSAYRPALTLPNTHRSGAPSRQESSRAKASINSTAARSGGLRGQYQDRHVAQGDCDANPACREEKAKARGNLRCNGLQVLGPTHGTLRKEHADVNRQHSKQYPIEHCFPPFLEIPPVFTGRTTSREVLAGFNTFRFEPRTASLRHRLGGMTNYGVWDYDSSARALPFAWRARSTRSFAHDH